MFFLRQFWKWEFIRIQLLDRLTYEVSVWTGHVHYHLLKKNYHQIENWDLFYQENISIGVFPYIINKDCCISVQSLLERHSSTWTKRPHACLLRGNTVEQFVVPFCIWSFIFHVIYTGNIFLVLKMGLVDSRPVPVPKLRYLYMHLCPSYILTPSGRHLPLYKRNQGSIRGCSADGEGPGSGHVCVGCVSIYQSKKKKRRKKKGPDLNYIP